MKKPQISVKIISLGELVVDTFISHHNGIEPLLKKYTSEISYPVQMEAEVIYQRGGSPEETIITIQKGTSATAVSRTLVKSIPRKGKRLLRLEIKVERYYKDIKS